MADPSSNTSPKTTLHLIFFYLARLSIPNAVLLLPGHSRSEPPLLCVQQTRLDMTAIIRPPTAANKESERASQMLRARCLPCLADPHAHRGSLGPPYILRSALPQYYSGAPNVLLEEIASCLASPAPPVQLGAAAGKACVLKEEHLRGLIVRCGRWSKIANANSHFTFSDSSQC